MLGLLKRCELRLLGNPHVVGGEGGYGRGVEISPAPRLRLPPLCTTAQNGNEDGENADDDDDERDVQVHG